MEMAVQEDKPSSASSFQVLLESHLLTSHPGKQGAQLSTKSRGQEVHAPRPEGKASPRGLPTLVEWRATLLPWAAVGRARGWNNYLVYHRKSHNSRNSKETRICFHCIKVNHENSPYLPLLSSPIHFSHRQFLIDMIKASPSHFLMEKLSSETTLSLEQFPSGGWVVFVLVSSWT